MADPKIVVKIEGAEEVIQGFEILKDQIPSNAVPSALRKAASWLTAEVQRGAPRGGSRGKDLHAGQLEAAIVMTTTRRRGQKSSVGVGIRKQAYYWRFLELGWNKGGRRFQYPFIKPVVEAGFQQAAQIVINDLKRTIDRIANRAFQRFLRGG